MIQALSGRLIAEVLNKDTRLESGLYLPENAKEVFYLKVKVLSCGSDYTRIDKKVIKAPCKDNDIIHIARTYRRPVNISGKKCVLLTFEDVIGVEDGR